MYLRLDSAGAVGLASASGLVCLAEGNPSGIDHLLDRSRATGPATPPAGPRRTRIALLLLFVVTISPSVWATDDPRTIPPDELPQHLVKILRTSNKAQTNRYVPKVYDLQNVNPYAVIRFVRRVMEIEEGAWYSFASPDMKSGKLLVVCPEYQIAGLDQLISYIDRPNLNSYGDTLRVAYRIKNRDATDPGFQNVVALDGTPTIALTPDPQINAWLVEDAPSGIARLQEALAVHDNPIPNAEIEVTVYEVDVTDDGQIGLDYVSWKNGPGRNLFAIGAFAEKEKISTLGGGPGALVYNSGKGTFGLPSNEFESTGRNGAYLFDVPSAYFDFLAAQGCARVLTRSKLSALCGSVGLLEIAEDILFYQENQVPDARAGARLAPLDPFGDLDQPAGGQGLVQVTDYPDNRTVVPTTTSRSLGAVQTGFFLRFLPVINVEDVFVDLFLSFVDLTGFADDGTPVLASRVIDTRLHIPPNGQEITLGSMVRTRRIDSTNKIPWLGDIPVLGFLFGSDSYIDQKNLVVVTMRLRVAGTGTMDEHQDFVKRVAEREAEIKALENNPGYLNK